MPRYGLVKYDYNCLLKYEIIKKKKRKKKCTIGYVSFHSFLIFRYIVFFSFCLFFLFHTFTLHSFHPKSYNVYQSLFCFSAIKRIRSIYRFYVCCILNPIIMKISLDCDQCFSKRMTRLFRSPLVIHFSSLTLNSVSDTNTAPYISADLTLSFSHCSLTTFYHDSRKRSI